MEENCKLILGNCLDKLKDLPSDSVDLIASDPPYQLDSITKRFGKEGSAEAQFGKDGAFQRASKGFMGKAWDVLPSVEILKECQRVLKAGAFAFWMMTPRQDSQAEFIMRLKQAGFVIGFTSLYWCFASGFPKSENISLSIDKRECKKQLTEKLGRKPTKEEFKKEWKDFRKIIGRGISGKKESHSTYNMAFEEGKKSSLMGGEYDITIPSTPEAKALDGSFAGFQPKPAVEVIVVSMKPLSEKTYVEQALKNGRGVTWLGDCRIPYASENDIRSPLNSFGIRTGNKPQFMSKDEKQDYNEFGNNNGRFPANLLVSDDVLNNGTVSKDAGIGGRGGFGRGEGYGFKPTGEKDIVPPTGEGSFSRYFSLDAWWADKVKLLPKEQRGVFPFLIEPKASKSEKNENVEGEIEGKTRNSYNRKCLKCGKWERNQGIDPKKYTCFCEQPEWEKPKGNFHPTCKPISLMTYLITLGSRPKDLVLDPFLGSGTTGVAALMLNRRFVGIEIEKEYYEIAQKRIADWKKQTHLF